VITGKRLTAKVLRVEPQFAQLPSRCASTQNSSSDSCQGCHFQTDSPNGCE